MKGKFFQLAILSVLLLLPGMSVAHKHDRFVTHNGNFYVSTGNGILKYDTTSGKEITDKDSWETVAFKNQYAGYFAVGKDGFLGIIDLNLYSEKGSIMSNFPAETILCLAQCPTNPDVIAAMDEGTPIVYISEDFGESWTQYPFDYDQNVKFLSNIEYDPYSENTLYVSYYTKDDKCGIVGSKDGGKTWNDAVGVTMSGYEGIPTLLPVFSAYDRNLMFVTGLEDLIRTDNLWESYTAYLLRDNPASYYSLHTLIAFENADICYMLYTDDFNTTKDSNICTRFYRSTDAGISWECIGKKDDDSGLAVSDMMFYDGKLLFLSGNSFISAFNPDDLGAVESIDNAGSNVRISLADNRICIEGLDEAEIVNVYDMNGRTIYSGRNREVPVSETGIYAVKACNAVSKVSVK